MALTRSNDDMDWLPGLGKSSHGASNSFSAPRADPETAFNTQVVDDEVQYSIECEDCGKHFWSRAKAHSHAALTAHVLRKPNNSPLSPRSPATISASAPEMVTLFSEREREASSDPDTLFLKTEAVASPDLDLLDQDFSEGSGDIICVDCDRRFRSYEAINNHAKRVHMLDTEIVPSSVPDGFPASTADTAGPAVKPTYSTANPSIHTDSVYWNTKPGYIYLGGKHPTPPYLDAEQTIPHAIFPTHPLYDGGENTTSTYGTTRATSNHSADVFRGRIAGQPVPDVSQ